MALLIKKKRRKGGWEGGRNGRREERKKEIFKSSFLGSIPDQLNPWMMKLRPQYFLKVLPPDSICRQIELLQAHFSSSCRYSMYLEKKIKFRLILTQVTSPKPNRVEAAVTIYPNIFLLVRHIGKHLGLLPRKKEKQIISH